MIFLEPNVQLQSILLECANFASKGNKEGMIAGLPIKKNDDDSVTIPIALTATVFPAKQQRDGRMYNSIMIQMPWSSPNQEFDFVFGSRKPTKYTGKDKITLYFKFDEESEGDDDGYDDPEADMWDY